jgi:hypothetical protein
MALTKEDIITTDKYYNSFPSLYYKTDAMFLNISFDWRGIIVNPPGKNLKIIISGHSDYPITDNLVDQYNPNFWFTVNKQTTRPNVFSIPLGITNDTNESDLHPIYGNLDCMTNVMQEQIEHKNFVYMNININTYPIERQFVWDLFNNKEWVTIGTIENTIEGRTKFLRDIKAHTFVLCPRGNGIDTHRLWETLYMGSIPIVKRDIGYSDFEDLPICFVNDWSEITVEFLEDEKQRIQNTNWNLEKLKMSYWINKINEFV